MKYATVCSGIGAPEVAWSDLGWMCIAQAEIAKFPSRVLSRHFPHVKNLGDLTEPDFVDRLALCGVPELLCGGVPCQPFSIAGLRRSMNDERNLTLEFVRLANAVDDLRRVDDPAWILWENVPGVLSTADNAFGAFLGGLAGCDAAVVNSGAWPGAGVVAGPRRVVAWRILDAQYFGVAQRRRRVFVLARGRAAPCGGWSAADALLPLTDSGSRNPAPHVSEAQGLGPVVHRGSGGAAIARCITKGYGRRLDPETETFVSDAQGLRYLTPEEVETVFGFPTGYTAIPGASAGARWSALGNSMAVPVMAWIGRRIAEVSR